MWAVNPRRSLRGLATFASVSELPAAPDAAFVGVDCDATPEVVRELAAIGAGAAVCYASGFAEIGETGVAKQHRLLEAAGDMPLIGPNCYGTLSAVTGAALWPDVHGLARSEGGIALLSQSGNIAVNLTMQRRNLDIACVMALGNQADVGLGEALETAVADPSVTAVGLVIEAVDDVDRFAAAVNHARAKGLPIVSLKLGASEASRDIAVTHTASLVGSDVAYDALFERLGVCRVYTVAALLDTLGVLTQLAPLQGNRIVSLSCSGGEAALVADRGRDREMVFPSFAPDHRRRVEAAFEGRVAVTNPLDYQTFIWGEPARLHECFSAVLHAEPGEAAAFDAAMLMLDFPAVGLDWSRWWPTLEAFGAACQAGKIPGLVVASMAENLTEDVRIRAAELGLASCSDIDNALSALQAAAALAQPTPSAPSAVASEADGTAHSGLSARAPSEDRRSLLVGSDATARNPAVAAGSSKIMEAQSENRVVDRARGEVAAGSSEMMEAQSGTRMSESRARSDVAVLAEHKAKRRLADAGVLVPNSRLVSAQQAVAAACEIGFPVVVKATGLTHKTEFGGVAVGLTGPGGVADAITRITSHLATNTDHADAGANLVDEPQMSGVARVHGGTDRVDVGEVLVESHVTGALAELLINVRDESPVGTLLTLGAGGTLAELIDDTVGVLAPASPADIAQALRRLRIWPLLAGHRGQPPACIDSVVEAICAMTRLVSDNEDILELEVNPLLALPDSAVAVDALMLIAQSALDDAAVGNPSPDRHRARRASPQGALDGAAVGNPSRGRN